MKAKQTRERNWIIFILRGIWANIHTLKIPDDLKKEASDSIDRILLHYGADTELIHRQKIRDEHKKKWSDSEGG